MRVEQEDQNEVESESWNEDADDGGAVGQRRYWPLGEYWVLLHHFQYFLHLVLNTSQTPFAIHYDGRSKRVAWPTKESGESGLAFYFHLCRQFMDFDTPGREHRADLVHFFECYAEHPFGWMCRSGVPDAVTWNGQLEAEVYNDFIAHLRSAALTYDLKQDVLDWDTDQRSAHDSISDFLLQCTENRPRLLMRWVDLAYPECAAVEGEAMPRPGIGLHVARGMNHRYAQSLGKIAHGAALEYRARIDVGEAMRDRDLFLDPQRGPHTDLFDPMVGYACHLRISKSYGSNVLRILFLFDTDEVRDVGWLEELVWQRWASVTGGRGFAVNCSNGAGNPGAESVGTWAPSSMAKSNPWSARRLAESMLCHFSSDSGAPIVMKPKSDEPTLTIRCLR